MKSSETYKILEDVDCSEIVRKKLNRECLNNYKLINHQIVHSSDVNGFMGQYLSLLATVMEPDSQDSRVIKFFIKLPPPAGSPQDVYNQEMGIFNKEFNLYSAVFPQIMSGIENHFYVPGCFLALENKLVVLDDMLHRGFKMANKYEPFDYDHCAVLMKTLGKFHAKSIIFEEVAKKRISDEFPDCVRETLWPLDKSRAMKMFEASAKSLPSMVDLIGELSEDNKIKFKHTLVDLSVDHAKNLLPSKKSRNVLCHGDLWANNLLFKYNEDGKPINCCLVDFQFARYNPPAHDILCFLQLSTVHDLRMQRLDDLLRIYHTSLTDCLIESGVDPSVFSWKELVHSIEDLRVTSMIHGILNIPIMLLDEEAVKKYFINESHRLEEIWYSDRSPLVCEQFIKVPAYRERMKDSFLELYKFIFGRLSS